jgi:CBS domain-containing protein
VQVRDAMTKSVLVVGPEHTVRQVARQMADRRVGSAVVHDPDAEGFGIMTERDILYAIGRGLDPDTERAANHLTWEVVYATPEWTLEDAAAAMVRGGFRHLVVIEGGEVIGVISVRDILRVWTQHRVPVAMP